MNSLLLGLALIFASNFALADAVPGQPAPAFSAKDATGKTRTLADAKGKWMVLEWFNQDCPFVKKHYDSGNMQKLQKSYTDKGALWLTVASSAKGKQGFMTPEQATKVMTEKKAGSSAVLLDETGVIGKAYGAKTTPHMFVIDPTGKVVYAGGIDDNDSSDAAVIPKSKNFIALALDAGMAGKKIETASARPYGCSIKYQ